MIMAECYRALPLFGLIWINAKAASAPE